MNPGTMPISSDGQEWHELYSQAVSPVEMKPVRRRSRVSKRTQTMLLSANAQNFRALVQQFTGCPSINRKGPLNLDFGLKNATPIVENTTHRRHYYSQPPPQQRQQIHECSHKASLRSSSSLGDASDNRALSNDWTTGISDGLFVMDDMNDLSINDYGSLSEYNIQI